MNKLRLGAVALCFGLCTGPVMAQDITVAIAGPMTGQYASFGMQLKTGAEQAVADINAAGGVLGRKLKLEVADDACDPKQARSIAEKLAGMRVAVVVGAGRPTVTINRLEWDGENGKSASARLETCSQNRTTPW